MRLRLRTTGDALRLTGTPSGLARPGPPALLSLLVTENGEPLVTERGEQFWGGPSHGKQADTPAPRRERPGPGGPAPGLAGGRQRHPARQPCQPAVPAGAAGNQ